MDESGANEMPSAILKAEHEVILRAIDVLERLVGVFESGGVFERESFAMCVEFFRCFADACHHAKEEDLLFPALESRGIPREGGPIGVMLSEHQQARRLTREMGEALESVERDDRDGRARFVEAARGYMRLLTDHIYKENNVLFMMGDRVMTDDDQTTLCAKFCEVGCRSFGGKKRDELERMVSVLETRWPSE